MPGYRTHLTTAGAAAAATIVATHMHLPLTHLITVQHGTCIIASLLGGLFPDIDIKSKGQKLLYTALMPLFAAALITKHTVALCLLGALAIIPPILPHRGLTHELWFVFLAPLTGPGLVHIYQPSYLPLAIDLYIFFVLGAITHLWLDMGTIGMLKRSLPFKYGPKRR